MGFKKDYINYVLHNVIDTGAGTFTERESLRRVLKKIIASSDVVRTAFIIGKTAGLELLFKYVLYISDKIDKSQITIFNLKDNFEYDVQNLKRICGKINISGNGKPSREAVQTVSEIPAVEESVKEKPPAVTEQKAEEKEAAEPVSSETIIEEKIPAEESAPEEEMVLIENEESAPESDVFGLADITESLDRSAEETVSVAPGETVQEEIVSEEPAVELPKEEEKSVQEAITMEEKPVIRLPEREAVPRTIVERRESGKEEPVANEVYYRFETNFFEEGKILEKLFTSISRSVRARPLSKVSDKLLQSFTEIIEISSELSDLSRQLSLDITADVFFTINLFFTRAIKTPSLVNYERVNLFKSTLALVDCLIKGKNYLDYDKVVEKIESLRNELLKPPPAVHSEKEKEFIQPPPVAEEKVIIEEKQKEVPAEKPEQPETKRITFPRPPARVDKDMDAVIFKMKYLVKEFEKEFMGLINLQGEYSKFDALEKVDELNKYLRILAKISYEMNSEDILKLSEVSYVFLKYLKDYRMDLMEPEIQQIIKYIIFTFKMLLTDRKPEDFNVLVQYLNNPVKIFTDT